MLVLEGIKKSFREPNGHLLPVLDVPQFRIDAGEQVILVGKSGGGKTTLLHVIAGITRADAGRIEFDRRDIGRLSEPARDRYRAAKIGYVFQTFNLLPAFNALENVELWRALSQSLALHDTQLAWVRGHNGHPKNEYANDLAVRAAKAQETSGGFVASGFPVWLDRKRAAGHYSDYDPDAAFLMLEERLARGERFPHDLDEVPVPFGG